MKVRIFSLVLVVMLSLLAFASCGETEEVCEHTFSDTWSSDATNHWHAATCEHGEEKGSLAAHADADEDGKCDVCAYEVGHTHTYASAWSTDETNHWKEATCTHTSEKGENGLHTDENTDGECDVCEAHVHILDGAGFCTGCNDQIKSVDENDIGSVISATTARLKNVVSGSVDYTNLITSSVTGNVTSSVLHKSDYSFGTNGTYISRTMLNAFNQTVLEENWIPSIDAEDIIGVTTIKIEGELEEAQPSAFGRDNLIGYYFAASTLADGYGPENLLYNLYNISVGDSVNKVSNVELIHDAENNIYTYSYNILVINTDTAEGEDDGVNYFEVSMTFKYADNYTLLELDATVDCYTNSLADEAEHDYTYDQATKTITMKENASADTYHYVVKQLVGTRGAIEMNDGSQYTPTDFELYVNEEFTEKAESVSVTIGNNEATLYIGCTPANSFISFIKYDANIVVTDSEGNVSNGLVASLTGDVIYLLPMQPGEYVVTFSAVGKTKSVEVSVEDVDIPGEHKIQVVGTTTYEWTDLYEFKVEQSGTYTFYAPYGLGIWLDSEITQGAPRINPVDPENDSTSFTVTLRRGTTFKFYYLVYVANTTYFIGYDYTAPQS